MRYWCWVLIMLTADKVPVPFHGNLNQWLNPFIDATWKDDGR